MTVAMSVDTVADLRAREITLQRQLVTAQVQLEAAQGALIEGSGSFEQLTQAQASVSGLESTLEQLGARIKAAEARDQAIAAAERRAALLAIMRDAAQTADDDLKAIYQLVPEIKEKLEALFLQIGVRLDSHSQARQQFAQAGIKLAPGLGYKGWQPRGQSSSEAQIRAQNEADMLLSSLNAEGISLEAVLTPMFQFSSETSRDRNAPFIDLQGDTFLLKLWGLLMLWQGTRSQGHNRLEIYFR